MASRALVALSMSLLAGRATAECNPPMKCSDPTVQACWLHHAALGCPHGASGAACDLCDPGAGGGPLCDNVKSAEGCCAACNEWNLQHTADFQCNAWIWNASPDDPSAHAPRCLLKNCKSWEECAGNPTGTGKDAYTSPGSDWVGGLTLPNASNCTVPPPPPLNKNPCIRFGHTIPVEHHVDVTITQDSDHTVFHTWSNYKFGDFSDWVNVFKPGTGTITVWENTGGTRGAVLYQKKGIPLTPGPLVVVIKVAASQVSNATGYWPPALPDSIETIAASYVESSANSKIRLFNLSPDTKLAGMTCSANGTKEIVSGVDYSLGSDWVTVPTASVTFSATDGSKTIASKVETPPAAPLGATNMLLGLQGAAGGDYAIELVPLADAPEGGTCHP